jgi:hypothetical protein
MGGTVAFGKLAAMVQCATLAPFNWSPVAANVLSEAGRRAEHGCVFAFLVGEGFDASVPALPTSMQTVAGA